VSSASGSAVPVGRDPVDAETSPVPEFDLDEILERRIASGG
jgi:hypothetical protein